MTPTVAILGLGAMGQPVAEKLSALGTQVSAYDVAAPARERARRSGVVRTEESAAVAVRGADVIVLSLPGPEEVRSAVAGPLRDAAAGAVVADLSTIDPKTAQHAHRSLDALGISYVDAPVLGRPASCGQWTLPAGGPAESVDRIRELFEASIAERVIRVGDTGAGSVVKLLNNLMFGAINAITVEVVNICRLAGVRPEDYVEAVAGSSAATVSPLFRDIAPRLLSEDYSPPTFKLRLLHKDNKLALELAQSLAAPVFISDSIHRVNMLAVNGGLGDLDTAGLLELYQQLSPPEEEAQP